jgi:hypothetical protein
VTPGGLTEIPQKITNYKSDQLILKYAGGDTILPYRAMTVMIIESSGNPNAISPKENGDPLAYGLMQLLPATAKEAANIDANALLVPDNNVKAGVAYLRKLGENPCPDTAGKIAVAKKVVCNYGVICNNTDYQYIYAAYNGGYNANFCSTACPQQTWWQCTKNPRYGQTRTYVKRADYVYKWLEQNKVLG